MPWVKLDDDFSDHRKIMAVGPLAAWMHVCALCYCARLLTDGFIPAAQVRKLADVDDATSLAALLVREGLWQSAEGGYRIHDYLEYNPSREQVEATKAVRAEAGKQGGIKSGVTRQANVKQFASPVASTMYEAKTNPVPVPVPSPDSVPEPKRKRQRGASPPRFAPPSPDEAEGEFVRHGFGGKRLGAKFVTHYSKVGWRFPGGLYMTDWPSAIESWVQRELDKAGSAVMLSPRNGTSSSEKTLEDQMAIEAEAIARLGL